MKEATINIDMTSSDPVALEIEKVGPEIHRAIDVLRTHAPLLQEYSRLAEEDVTRGLLASGITEPFGDVAAEDPLVPVYLAFARLGHTAGQAFEAAAVAWDQMDSSGLLRRTSTRKKQ